MPMAQYRQAAGGGGGPKSGAKTYNNQMSRSTVPFNGNLPYSYGADVIIDEMTMIKAGTLDEFTVYLERDRTSGSVVFVLQINGVDQNGAGETLTIDGTNVRSHKITFPTPIAYVANDFIGCKSTSSSFQPSSVTSATIIYERKES